MKKDDYYLVAVSGGPDSTYLVHWLWKHKYRNLILAHVNYHWRADSDYDQALVKDLAKQFQLPLEIKSVFAHQQKPPKENFEAWARQTRYQFFENLKKKYNTDKLVVGHQQNDLIETFLLQQQRHGLVNYYGLPKLTHHHELTIWRPLLSYKKSHILAWLEQHHIPYALDSTNNDLSLHRNQLRHQLNESDFPSWQEKIALANKRNKTEMAAVLQYLASNQSTHHLLLQPKLRTWSQNRLQRLIYQFFRSLGREKYLVQRKKQLTPEIARRIKESTKNFWSINLGNHLLIKDYNFLRLLSAKQLPPPVVVINEADDYSRLDSFLNKRQIIETIEQHHEQFPYQIWTLKSEKIRGRKWRGKPLSKTLAHKRMDHEKRLKTGVIYSLNEKKLLDFWDWQLC